METAYERDVRIAKSEGRMLDPIPDDYRTLRSIAKDVGITDYSWAVHYCDTFDCKTDKNFEIYIPGPRVEECGKFLKGEWDKLQAARWSNRGRERQKSPLAKYYLALDKAIALQRKRPMPNNAQEYAYWYEKTGEKIAEFENQTPETDIPGPVTATYHNRDGSTRTVYKYPDGRKEEVVTPVPVKKSPLRADLIEVGTRSYTGRRISRDRPYLWGLRKHTGMRDITGRERDTAHAKTSTT